METPGDRAVAILRSLDAARTDAPTPASGRDRIAARLADTGLAIVFAAALIACANVATALIYGNRGGDAYRHPEPGEVIIGLGVIVVWGLALVWNEALGPGRRGQSIGKRLMGIHVVRADGSPASAGRRLGRWVTWMVAVAAIVSAWSSVVGGWSPALQFVAAMTVALAVSGCLVGRRGRGVHDLLWDTKLQQPR